jgi:biotin carboxyl carrier protein
MFYKTIEKLVKLTSESNISELVVRNWFSKVTITKRYRGEPLGSPIVEDSVSEGEKRERANLVFEYVRAKNPGNFSYLEGGKRPLIEVGDRVDKGRLVGVIIGEESLYKLESEFEGIVSDRLVDEGNYVEYNQPIYKVRLEKDNV